MDIKTAINAVEFAFKGPSPHIKIEFQGGEPLLNFDVVKAIVDHAEKINHEKKKIVEFVLCSNMVNIKNNHLDYIKQKKIYISTSLDGPRDIHNKYRILRNGKGSYDHVVSNMDWVKSELGPGAVSALMTVTPHNVKRLKEVIDEYLYHELEYIFIRKINPLGYAYQNAEIYYSNDEFIDGYRNALKYLIEINLNGTLFPEAFTTILLSRILTPFSTGFVDLQSPTGAGISGIIYDVNGDIYVSDEARMMYRTTGDKFFCIGNVITSTWKEVYEHPVFREMINQSCTSAIPGCAWCAYQPYCGSDPVRNYFTQKSMIGHRPTNEFCSKHKAIFDTLFEYLKSEDEDVEDVFWSWLTNRRVDQIRLHASILPEE
jgi:His-Xaa-Ser system radical SAM maturase HxsB